MSTQLIHFGLLSKIQDGTQGPVSVGNQMSGLDESVSELEDGVGCTGGDAVEKPLPRHLGQEMGCLSGGSAPCI